MNTIHLSKIGSFDNEELALRCYKSDMGFSKEKLYAYKLNLFVNPSVNKWLGRREL